MAWPADRLVVETTFALGADLTADPSTWTFGTDITPYTFDRDGDSSIVIARGRANESTVSQPASTVLSLNDSDGRFLDHYPLGAYYGQLRRNTPLRVRVNPGTGLVTRNVVFTSEMPPRWDPAEADHYIPVRADGVLRRLGQGAVSKSAALRTFTSPATTIPPIAYWPCEDKPTATSAFNPIDPAFSGTVPVPKRALFGQQGPAGSAGGVHLVTGEALVGIYSDNRPALRLPIPVHTAGELVFAFWVEGSPFTETVGTPAATDLVAIESWVNFADGDIGSFLVRFTERVPGIEPLTSFATFDAWSGPDITGLEHGIEIYTMGGPQIFDGGWHQVQVRMAQNGANVDVALWLDGVQYETETINSVTLGRPHEIKLGTAGGVTGLTETTPFSVMRVSTVTVHNDTAVSATDLYDAGRGYPGELAGTRFSRLCAEEGVFADVATGSNQTMGAQPAGKLLDLLRECEAAEAGLIVERRTGELGFDPHTVRENQAVALTLNYDSGHISPPLEPTDDDQLTRNDVTVTRDGGSSARVVDEDGPLGVNTVGRYDDGLTLNLETDDQAYHAAGWRVNVGTADFLRFPTITVNLRRNASLVAAWLALDIGSRIKLTNLPDIISFDDVDLIVEGYTEQISQKNWIITFNCAPYKPYLIGELATAAPDTSEFAQRLAGDPDAAIRVAIDDNDTSIQFDPNRFRWDTAAEHFDPDLRVRFGGETADVSAISTTPVTFVAAGTPVGGDNVSVTPGLPAGTQTRDLLLLFAGIRNSGTGTVNTPTGYTRLPVWTASDNVALFAKVHTGSESAPLVSFTGGVAGATTTAKMCAFRATPSTLTDLTDIVVLSHTLLSASAQNIAHEGIYPVNVTGCVILLLGWKQDDWTSVATVTGFTEIDDVSSTPGDDQGLVWDYQIQTTPDGVSAGSFVVTGGVSAISRSAIVALAAGYQTMTVSARSVNGVVKSHAAGTKIEVDNPFRLGL